MSQASPTAVRHTGNLFNFSLDGIYIWMCLHIGRCLWWWGRHWNAHVRPICDRKLKYSRTFNAVDGNRANMCCIFPQAEIVNFKWPPFWMPVYATNYYCITVIRAEDFYYDYISNLVTYSKTYQYCTFCLWYRYKKQRIFLGTDHMRTLKCFRGTNQWPKTITNVQEHVLLWTEILNNCICGCSFLQHISPLSTGEDWKLNYDW